MQETYAILDQLFKEVCQEETTLAGGIKLGIAGSAVKSLKETRILFGNPKNLFFRVTENNFKDCGVELNSIHLRQINDLYNFYHLTLSADLIPSPGVCFSNLVCKLDFGPKGNDEPIVENIFPKNQWKEMLSMGINLNLGLDANLEWNASTEINNMLDLNAKLINKNELKTFVTIPKYEYHLGKNEIVSNGEGNSYCLWRIEKPELKKTQTLKFAVLFKVPKHIKSIELSGLIFAEPDFKWLTSNLKDVFEHLGKKSKNLFTGKNKHKLPIGDHEKWVIDLELF